MATSSDTSATPQARTLSGVLVLLRPVNAMIVFATITAAGALANPDLTLWLQVLVASFAGALIAGGGNAINDCFDLEIDRINRPDRPLPSGSLSLRTAKTVWICASLLGLALSALLTISNLLIALFWVFALYFYSRYLKRSVLLGNLLVGFMTGLAFLFGALVVNHPERALFPGLFAFLVNLSRELVKDVEDLEGDRRVGAITLPVKHGVRAGLTAASVTILLLIAATFVPYSIAVYNSAYLRIVLFVDLALLYVVFSIWHDESRSNLKSVSRILKLIMVAGLIAIFVGS
jgi:geranylgeranylglycerol-phosphate geranylgeranyltransferase